MIGKLLARIGITLQHRKGIPVLHFPAYGKLTTKDTHLGVGLIGSSGSGKSVAIRQLALGHLLAGCGATALSVKPSAPAEFEQTVDLANRRDDLHILNGENGECLNCFKGLVAADVQVLLRELSLLPLSARSSNSSEPFWEIESSRNLRALAELNLALNPCANPQVMLDLLRTLPSNSNDLDNPIWREGSLAWSAIKKIRESGSHNARHAVEGLCRDYVTLNPKTQSSVRAIMSGLLDFLLREPLYSMFCGKPTVTLEQVLNEGKIILVGIAAHSSDDGKLANAIVQHCFLKCAMATKPTGDSFFLSDECQETVTNQVRASLCVLREHRVSCILATQHLGALHERLGNDGAEALLDAMNTLVFLGQSSADTREWASHRIGERRRIKESRTTGNAGTSVSEYHEWQPRVHSSEFLHLKPGESIVFKRPDFWRARWSMKPAGELFKVRIPKR